MTQPTKTSAGQAAHGLCPRCRALPHSPSGSGAAAWSGLEDRRARRPRLGVARILDDHGVGLDEYIIKNGLLRADGKTLVAQPHVRDDLPMWTIDDIRRCNLEIIDPLQVPPPAPAESNGAAS